VESLRGKLKSGEKHQGEEKLFQHSSFLSGKAICKTKRRGKQGLFATVPAPVMGRR
jgi:hypothetical protein